MTELSFFNRRKTTPEQDLWDAIVFQAVLDCFSPAKGWGADYEIVRALALQWLTAKDGPDAEARAYVCFHANIDPDVLRDRVIRALEGEDVLGSLGNGGTAESVAEARAAWLRLRDRPKMLRVAHSAAGRTEPVGSDGPFLLNSAGALFYQGPYFPAGKYHGHFLPSTQFGIGKVFAAVTSPKGGSLAKLRKAHTKNWEGLLQEILAKWPHLDFVWLKDGLPSDESVPDAKCYFIPRAVEVSTSLAA